MESADPMKEYIDKNPMTETNTIFHASGDDVAVETVQNVTDIIDISKEQYNDSAGERYGLRAQVARIPTSVYWDLVRRGIANDKEAFAAWLNDSDNRVWRTRPGRI